MRWMQREEPVHDGGISRLRQWVEINIAALYEGHRQQKRRLDELDARVQALESMPPAWVRVPEEYKRHRQVEL